MGEKTIQAKLISSIDELRRSARGDWILIEGRIERVFSNEGRGIGQTVKTIGKNGEYLEERSYYVGDTASLNPDYYVGFDNGLGGYINCKTFLEKQ